MIDTKIHWYNPDKGPKNRRIISVGNKYTFPDWDNCPWCGTPEPIRPWLEGQGWYSKQHYWNEFYKSLGQKVGYRG